MSAASNSDSPRLRFVRALRVERNAKAGFALGIAFATVVFVWFVYVPDRQYSIVLWLMLTFVLSVGTGLLLTVAFTLVTAVRLVRSTDDEGQR